MLCRARLVPTLPRPSLVKFASLGLCFAAPKACFASPEPALLRPGLALPCQGLALRRQGSFFARLGPPASSRALLQHDRKNIRKSLLVSNLTLCGLSVLNDYKID